jgi:predicted SpoU family rRNA methylase
MLNPLLSFSLNKNSKRSQTFRRYIEEHWARRGIYKCLVFNTTMLREPNTNVSALKIYLERRIKGNEGGSEFNYDILLELL